MDFVIYLQLARAVVKELWKFRYPVLLTGFAVGMAMVVWGMFWQEKYETKATIYADQSNIISPLLAGQAAATRVDDQLQVVRDILPSLYSELRKLLYFMLRAIPLLILLLIPLVNVAASVLWVLFSAWMMTVQYIDYPMANHRLFFKDQRARLRRRPVLAWSFGGVVMLCTMIPVLNFFVMPAAVAGATSLWVNEDLSKSAGQ